MKPYVVLMKALAAEMKFSEFEDTGGLNAFLPYLEEVRKDGSVFVLHIDGQAGVYTAIASSGPLGKDHLTAKAPSLADAVAQVVIAYAQRCWYFSGAEQTSGA